MPASSCPGPLQGRWFRSEYRCDSVVEVEWPRANDRVVHREWAASYQVEGRVVTVRYDGRWRDYRDREPSPPWNAGRPSVRRIVVGDRCTATSDQPWPRTLYREEGGCRAPHGAYAWSPGAPVGTPLPIAIYEGDVSPDGRMTLTRDPNARIFGSDRKVVLAHGWRAGRVRFVGEEPYERTDGGHDRAVSMLVDLDAASDLPANTTGLALLMVERAHHLAATGRRHEAVRSFAQAGIALRSPADPGRTRPSTTTIRAMILSRRLIGLDVQDPTWTRAASDLEEELRTAIQEVEHLEYEPSAGDRAKVVAADSALVEQLLWTDEGRAEAERLRHDAAVIAAAKSPTTG
jgi:hypothetical protein